MKLTKELAKKVGLPLAAVAAVGGLAVANHSNSAPQEQTKASGQPSPDFKPGDTPDTSVTIEPTTIAPTTTEAPAPTTTTTSEVKQEPTIEDICSALQNAKPGSTLTHVSNAYVDFAPGTTFYDGTGADAKAVDVRIGGEDLPTVYGDTIIALLPAENGQAPQMIYTKIGNNVTVTKEDGSQVPFSLDQFPSTEVRVDAMSPEDGRPYMDDPAHGGQKGISTADVVTPAGLPQV